MKRRKKRPFTDRFWEKVAVGNAAECWEWMACKVRGGYGQFTIGGGHVLAHRFSYELHNGPIPKGMCACHRCDNPGCVNPAHIFLGTHADNVRDKVEKGRDADRKGEMNGRVKLTEAQVLEIRARYAAGEISQRALAREYGMHRSSIDFIINRRTWRHI